MVEGMFLDMQFSHALKRHTYPFSLARTQDTHRERTLANREKKKKEQANSEFPAPQQWLGNLVGYKYGKMGRNIPSLVLILTKMYTHFYKLRIIIKSTFLHIYFFLSDFLSKYLYIIFFMAFLN